MSRIGKAAIEIVKGVEIKVGKDNIEIKGPKGILDLKVDPSIHIEVKDSKIILTRRSDEKSIKSMHGLYRSMISNMVKGVSIGFEKTLEISGVGYRAAVDGKKLILTMGYSHPVSIEAPPQISFTVEGQNRIKILGIDKQVVGQVAANVKVIRPVEPYKAKGIKYLGQYVRRKAGKAQAKAA